VINTLSIHYLDIYVFFLRMHNSRVSDKNAVSRNCEKMRFTFHFKWTHALRFLGYSCSHIRWTRFNYRPHTSSNRQTTADSSSDLNFSTIIRLAGHPREHFQHQNDAFKEIQIFFQNEKNAFRIISFLERLHR
jgi:hypothetical protein